MGHNDPHTVHVGSQHHPRTGALFVGNQIPHGVHGDLICILLRFPPDDLTNVPFVAGGAVGPEQRL